MPNTNLHQFYHGQAVQLAGSTAILIIEGFRRHNTEPYEATVRFACNLRSVPFPVPISELLPIPTTQHQERTQ